MDDEGLNLLDGLFSSQTSNNNEDDDEYCAQQNLFSNRSTLIVILRQSDERVRKILFKSLLTLNSQKITSKDKNIIKWLEWLSKHNILVKTPNKPQFILNDEPKKYLIEIIEERSSTNNNALKISEKNPKTPEQLHSYSRGRWESILNFIVSDNILADAKNIGKDLAEVLFHGNLVKASNDNNAEFGILSDGFRFLLKPLEKQIWIFILLYCSTISERQNQKISALVALEFICSLSLLEPFQLYSCKELNGGQKKILQNLREMGFVFKRKGADTSFYMTDLLPMIAGFCQTGTAFNDSDKDVGIELLLSKESNILRENEKQFIVVESNMHIYAYTASKLKLSLIGMFSEVDYQFCNMISGQLTKRSIQQALRAGIRAQEIINFLESHLHSVMQTNYDKSLEIKQHESKRFLPSNVAEQILIWETEDNMVECIPSVMYNEFNGDIDKFRKLKEFCEENLGLLKYSEDEMYIIADRNIHEQIVEFMQNNG